MRIMLIALCICLLPGCNRATLAQAPTEFNLENGLKVILMPLPAATKNTLVVLYDVGNLHDPAGKSGMAHLSEHLYVTAATANMKARNVQEYMSAYPDGWNAQTGDDYTVIATVFSPDQTHDEVGDAANRMRKINVDQADLDRELPRIDNELNNMYQGFPPLAVANHGRHYTSLLPHDGRRGGKIEDLKTVSVEEIQSWLDQYYKPNNATIILAGAFDVDKVRESLQEKFGSIQRGDKAVAGEWSAVAEKRVYEIELTPVSPNPTTRVGFTFKAPAVDDPLYAAFMVHTTRMQMNAMKQRQNIQDMPFIFRPLDDPGFFYAAINVKDNESPDEALKRLQEMVDQQTSAELKKFHITSTLANLAMFLGTKEIPAKMMAMNTYGFAFANGRRHQLGMDSGKLKEQFENLDAAAMQRAADQFFGKSNRITVVGTPVKR